MRTIQFNRYYNILVFLFLNFHIIDFPFFKGLNFGVDFKGGTLMKLTRNF